jgi:hypothetical protein
MMKCYTVAVGAPELQEQLAQALALIEQLRADLGERDALTRMLDGVSEAARRRRSGNVNPDWPHCPMTSRSAPVTSHVDTRQLLEARRVRGDDLARCSQSGRGNDEVVGAPRSSLAPHRHQKDRMGARHGLVIDHHRNRCRDLVDERLTLCPSAPDGELHADQQFGQGDCRDRNVVVV